MICFRFHRFRHFTASILDDLGTPIGIIQRILGHTNRKTTEGYLHSIGVSDNTIRKWKSYYEKQFNGSKKSHTDSHTAELTNKKSFQ